MDYSLCWFALFADRCEGSLERTLQTTAGIILADSHASVAKILNVTYKQTQKTKFPRVGYDETIARS